MNAKLRKLKAILKQMRSVVVAYSGGVDSTFLLRIAMDTLGKKNVLAVTAKSETFPRSELRCAEKITKQFGAGYLIITTQEFKNKNFVKNPVNRCYHCKKELFSKLKSVAKERNINYVIDGTNFDDLKDLRYGRKAALELGIRSPLMEARLKKIDIRNASRSMRLPTWDKGSFACLASRIPYGQKIEQSSLKKVEAAEDFLKSLNFRDVRVRLHRDLARIEVGVGEIGRFSKKPLRDKVINKFKNLGFSYIVLDLIGYRTGSMNEVLQERLDKEIAL
ncbi:MAG: TIGR00268 family protein [Candidatus Omnitrophica bacterium CG07_land_8_20_14_0_80_42_15]|uniref:TIGR00268 family protein n=1 Tax=Candidatus Aquitaenariimonas noxiae TaxID=1974741 RepID=A0A2J0KSM3_9BACT|nr:MAG: TIGR00268 family protein [Candidatus Omnitrophica bacterium CG07_land_8_20_14_0_80_42_15]